MTLYPAIDLKGGKAVRLTKGLMSSAKIYSNTPVDLAKAFEDMGARHLHVVDLDGAFAAKAMNAKTIENIAKNTGLEIQVGGGIRDEKTLEFYFGLGVQRCILGSLAAKDPRLVKDLAQRYNIAVGIDAKDGFVSVGGWASQTAIRAQDLAREYQNSKVQAVICTDISKDGTLEGINAEFTAQIKQACGLFTIASGGLRSMQDLEKLQDLGTIDGAIIGKAFYEGALDLKEALKIFK